jgi:hypothetical protein
MLMLLGDRDHYFLTCWASRSCDPRNIAINIWAKQKMAVKGILNGDGRIKEQCDNCLMFPAEWQQQVFANSCCNASLPHPLESRYDSHPRASSPNPCSVSRLPIYQSIPFSYMVGYVSRSYRESLVPHRHPFSNSAPSIQVKLDC